MPDLRGSQTADNLKAAFSLDSQTTWRYRYFSTIAHFEGHTELAQLFSEAAESDALSAHGHLDFLVPVGDPSTDMPLGDTTDNLAAALAEALQSARSAYPHMAKVARSEGFADIADWFETMAKARRRRATVLQKASDSLG